MDGPPVLLRNDTPRTGHWVGLRLLNRHGSPPVGARVELSTDGTTQIREVRSGSTYVSQNALELHFGLGAARRIGSIEVAWPGGGRSTLRDLPADQVITLNEP
jgi:hypothetical protein